MIIASARIGLTLGLLVIVSINAHWSVALSLALIFFYIEGNNLRYTRICENMAAGFRAVTNAIDLITSTLIER